MVELRGQGVGSERHLNGAFIDPRGTNNHNTYSNNSETTDDT